MDLPGGAVGTDGVAHAVGGGVVGALDLRLAIGIVFGNSILINKVWMASPC